jgi:hypothetical protein
MDIYTENVIGKYSSRAIICDSGLSVITTVWLKFSGRNTNCLYIKCGKVNSHPVTLINIPRDFPQSLQANSSLI